MMTYHSKNKGGFYIRLTWLTFIYNILIYIYLCNIIWLTFYVKVVNASVNVVNAIT